jgi:hypothetical protein
MNHPPKLTMPTRSAVDQRKPLKYTKTEHTDIRKTFEKFRRLASLQARQKGAA